jgi:hypothetical protein
MQRAKGMDPGKWWIPEEVGSLLQEWHDTKETSGKIRPSTMWNKEPVKNGRSGRDIA